MPFTMEDKLLLVSRDSTDEGPLLLVALMARGGGVRDHSEPVDQADSAVAVTTMYTDGWKRFR
jgi:hypothetical protein